MSTFRVIPILLLKDEGLIKTKGFKNPVYLGDPINILRIFNEKEADEIVLFDTTSSLEQRQPNYELIAEIVSESFMPLGYGGGINNLTQIKKLFEIGIEKVVINSASTNYKLIEEAANNFGNQSIVACIDVKKNLWGKYQVFTHSGSRKTNVDILEHISNLENAGIGEIIIQSIDNEGSMRGIDFQLAKTLKKQVKVPLVITGGIGSFEDILSIKEEINPSAVAAGSLFVFKGTDKGILINYPTEKIKNLLA